ncbi:uncharacterized protein LOC123660289 isoform X2 [Melitaea cinxia]|uniref:uncharacterized protein LOC123660289 isoform X2 n=1 Tax=Melitaea cinxia TaxID=113334 RepID=UPI001E272144|nr:uncharacterized protein LOC123660289 isoform X2 [Melitaea cinxia]
MSSHTGDLCSSVQKTNTDKRLRVPTRNTGELNSSDDDGVHELTRKRQILVSTSIPLTKENIEKLTPTTSDCLPSSSREISAQNNNNTLPNSPKGRPAHNNNISMPVTLKEQSAETNSLPRRSKRLSARNNSKSF